MLDVAGECARRFIAAGSILLERLHHDPVDLAPHQLRQPHGLGPPQRRDGRKRILETFRRVLGLGGSSSRMRRRMSEWAEPIIVSRSSGVVPVSSSYKSTPQRVDVASGVDAQRTGLGLFRTHVFERANDRAELREQRPLGQAVARSPWPLRSR